MSKSIPMNSWLEDVEAVEERLETLKSSAPFMPSFGVRFHPTGIVRATAGFLGKILPPGKVYQRRLRQDWEQNLRTRTS